MLILQYKVSFTYDRLGRCFRFVCIYARIAVFSVATVSRSTKHIYIQVSFPWEIWDPWILGLRRFYPSYRRDGSVVKWLACLTQAQKGLGSNRSRDAVG